MKEKNGFTLVELLAVIVILAVVMTIAITAVTPLMDKSQKGSLGSEGLSLVDAAQMAYQTQQMASKEDEKISPNSTVCFGLKWLNKKGYYTSKKKLDNYKGSVLVSYSANGEYSYKFWITDGSYAFVNDNPESTEYSGVENYSLENAIKVKKSTGGNEANINTAAENCGGTTVEKSLLDVSTTPAGGNTSA